MTPVRLVDHPGGPQAQKAVDATLAAAMEREVTAVFGLAVDLLRDER
ncbi:MAG TPA: hypothetical protein VHC41_05700 [Mycobacteriales bacterium]|nr:hypothetical protein [Mycobacteriales bacterium]